MPQALVCGLPHISRSDVWRGVVSMHKPKSHYRHMTPAKAQEIRRAYFSREAKQAEIAQRFGVRQNTISRIVSGQVWA